MLIVDDEASIRALAAEILGQSGYRPLTVVTGEEAVAVYEREGSRIDLVLLDLNMPGMGGASCIRELRRLNPKVRVIVASGQSGAWPAAAAPDVGTVGFLAKPYRISEFLDAVRTALDAAGA